LAAQLRERGDALSLAASGALLGLQGVNTELIAALRSPEPWSTGLRGEKPVFTIGTQSFTLDYDDSDGTAEWMRAMLDKALARLAGVREARHCGNCADGAPGGPDQCSKCGREQQYSHWTPAELAAEESLLAEQAQDMQRRADNDAEAIDPDDEPDFGTSGVEPSDSAALSRHTPAPAVQAEPVAWVTVLGEYAHIVWGSRRPDDNLHTIPLYAAPESAQPALMAEAERLVNAVSDAESIVACNRARAALLAWIAAHTKA
jgi:hypothetical protein